MGTRADFYVGCGEKAEWLGSIAWDGYPEGIPKEILDAALEGEFRREVQKFIENRDDGTFPKDGWPWPWKDSFTTDCAYGFDPKLRKVLMGERDGWYDRKLAKYNEDDGDWEYDVIYPPGFPDMTEKKNVTFGKRSGVIVVGMPPIVEDN